MNINNVIICVDDERIVLESLRNQLRSQYSGRYLFETADNAEEALELINELVLEKFNIVIIVSDWLMPGVKGDEFLIQVHKKHPNIVKIMLTGQADSDAIKNAFENAALLRCLSKPWKAEELFETIETGISKLNIN
jgi:DNA-binding NtrC family response regulator